VIERGARQLAERRSIRVSRWVHDMSEPAEGL
jgi:hypothetical protein